MGEEQTKSASVSTAKRRSASPLQLLGRWLLSLWWIFIIALGSAALAQSLGARIGPLAIASFPKIIAYLQRASSWIQVGVLLLTVIIFVGAGVLTWLAFKNRAVQAEEEALAVISNQREAFGQALDEHVGPELSDLSRQTQRVRQQGSQTYNVAVATEAKVDEISVVVTETRDIAKDIAGQQNRPPPLSAGVSLAPVGALQRETFKLGDDAAANFPYIRTPVAKAFDNAVWGLRDAAKRSSGKRGILVLGESNSGKTRLALESLAESLPEWELLRWSEARQTVDIPPVETFAGRHIALFVDDAQNYAGTVYKSAESSAQSISSAGAALRTVWETLSSYADAAVLVATCRSEDEAQTHATLGWLFDELHSVSIPSFSSHADSSEAMPIIGEFLAYGTVLTDAWDGTLGSLVLGLQRKRDQYEVLKRTNSQAVYVLRSMKLLTLAGIFGYTSTRLRHACAEILGQNDLLSEDAQWDAAVDDLLRLQFVSEELQPSRELALVIRKDSYFDAVIVDYPNPRRPTQFRDQRIGLTAMLVKLGDVAGLSALGLGWANSDDNEQAVSVYEEALRIDAQLFTVWHAKGLALLHLKRYEEALEACEAALLSNYSWIPVTWGLKGLILDHMERYEESLAADLEALRLEPQLSVVWSQTALTYNVLNRYEEALVAANMATRLDPLNGETWHQKGLALRGLGRDTEALTAYNEALRLDPQHNAWGQMGAVLHDLQRYAEMLAAYKEALSLGQDKTASWVWIGDALKHLGRYDEALEACEEALRLDPREAKAWANKGEVLHDMGRYDEALVAHSEAVRLDPKNEQAWARKAITLFELRRFDEELEACEEALRLDPQRGDIWANKGSALNNLRRYEEALEACDVALGLEMSKEQYASAWAIKAYSLSGLQLYEQALAAYEEALGLIPQQASWWAKKGDMLINLDRHEEAIIAYDQSLALDPSQATVWQNKAEVLIENSRRYDDALTACERALELAPESMRGWALKGTALAGLDRDDEAREAYEYVIDLPIKESFEWFWRGWALSKLGRNEEALQALDQALELDTSDVDAWEEKAKALQALGRNEEAWQAGERARALRKRKS